jgi:hypothetical protein
LGGFLCGFLSACSGIDPDLGPSKVERATKERRDD